jgi:hypothetical protein
LLKAAGGNPSISPFTILRAKDDDCCVESELKDGEVIKD